MYIAVILLVYLGMFLSLLPAVVKTGKVENHRFLGVLLPPQEEQDRQVLEMQARCRHTNRSFCLLWGIAVLPQLLLFPWPSLTMIYLLLWTFGGIAVWQFLQMREHRAMVDLAVQRGWYRTERKLGTVDTTLAKMKVANALSPWWFLLVLPLYLIPFLVPIPQGRPLEGVLRWSGPVVGMLSFGCFLLTRGSKGKIFSQDSRVNQRIDRRNRRGWCLFWLLSALCEGIVAVGIAVLLSGDSFASDRLWVLAPSLIPLAYLIWFLVSQQQYERRLLCLTDQEVEIPVSWEDPQGMGNTLFVPKTVGIGYTFNTSTPAGRRAVKILYVAVAALVIPLCILFVRLDFEGHTLQIQGETLTFSCPLYGSAVELEEVQSITLVDSLPENGWKTNGAATDRYVRGYFRYPGYGDCLLYVHCQSSPILVLQLPGETIFYNELEPQETQELYKQLLRLWQEPSKES